MILNETETDVLGELINIGVGRGAASLNQMLGSHITLSVPTIELVRVSSDLSTQLTRLYARQSAVAMSFSGGFVGNSLLSFSPESALILVNSLLELDCADVEGDDIDSLRASALVEVGNIVLNGVLGSLSNGLEVHLRYDVPVYEECSLDSLLPDQDPGSVQLIIFAKTIFRSDSLSIAGEIFILLELRSLDQFSDLLNRYVQKTLGGDTHERTFET